MRREAPGVIRCAVDVRHVAEAKRRLAGEGTRVTEHLERLPGRSGDRDTLVVQWNDVAREAMRNAKLGPPMVARALAILHTAIFDAWAAFDPVAVGTRLGDALRQPPRRRTPQNVRIAISYAAHTALKDFFPTETARFDAFMQRLGLDPSPAPLDLRTPRGIGTLAALAVVAYRHGDGSNQLGDLHPGAYSDYTGYEAVNTPDWIRDPNRWQPLRVADGKGGFAVQSFLGAQWGLVVPFAIDSGSALRPAGPRRLPADEAEFRRQAVEILQYSASLDDERKVIAEYWADGPGTASPPGHWCLFAHFVSRRDGHTLDQDVKLVFALANALLDASIVAWDAKRAYDSERPVTAIHHLFRGQYVLAWRGPYRGTGLIKGEDWQPYQPVTVVTPPFPEFVSGHSAFSSAGAEILRRFTGSDRFGARHTQEAGSSLVEPGAVPARDITLSWDTFSDAAAQAGLSRRYGGIHFTEADLVGRTLGRLTAEVVWNRAQAYWRGAPTTTTGH